jgi:hypothetical protein
MTLPVGSCTLKIPTIIRIIFVGYTEEWGVVGGGTQWRRWLRHCATSRKVAGLIPDVVTGNFSLT